MLAKRHPNLSRERAILGASPLEESLVVVGIDERGDADSLRMHAVTVPSI